MTQSDYSNTYLCKFRGKYVLEMCLSISLLFLNAIHCHKMFQSGGYLFASNDSKISLFSRKTDGEKKMKNKN